MIEEYKNILANKFMRDTNYIIIKDTDDLEELERQWQLFQSSLTVRQQRLSDDRSIQIWNMTNKQHYEALKKQLIGDLDIQLSDDEEHDSYIYEPEDEEQIEDDEITNLVNMSFDDFDIPDDENDITEPVEEGDIPTDGTENIEVIKDAPKWDIKLNKDTDKDNQADQYEIDSNINIIGTVKGRNVDDYLDNLEKAFKDWNAQNQDHRKKSDDKCREIYGMSNTDRYNKLKGDALKLKQTPVNKNVSPEELHKEQPLGEFVSEVYQNMKVINEQEYDKSKQHRRLNDTPYFTPTELIDMGVHGNGNYYSPQADNDGLITGIRIPVWFDSYKDMCLDHIFEDYTKDWIDTLDYLYSDFDRIKESGDQDKILARKQSILDLGWNPEIPFTRRNRQLASKRVSKLLDKYSPMNIFINLDKEVPDSEITDEEESIEEVVKKSTHKPVLLIFTQGKTPVISQGIKFFTGSAYSHASISFDPELNEVYSYNMRKENFGFIRENLSSFEDNVITVMAFFAPNNIVKKLKAKVEDFKNNDTFFDLRIFFNKVLHIDRKVSKNEYNQVCSTFVDTVLKSGNINLVGDINIPDPGQLYTHAKSVPNKIIEVFHGVALTYNGKKVKKKINALFNKNVDAINESVQPLPSGYSLRPANKDDTDFMFKCEMESIDKKLKNDPKVIKYIEKDVQDSIKITKIIMYKNETVGMLTTDNLREGSDFWYIGEIYLVKEHRGKGIGTILLKNEIARHDKIKLQVAQSNTKAKKLYESLGFEVVETDDKNKMYVMALDKTKKDDVVNERYIFSDKDFTINLDQWCPGNPLWITGTSGDGKSTLCNKMAEGRQNVLIVHTDTLLCRVSWSKEKYKDKMEKERNKGYNTIGDVMSFDYINQHPELPYNIRGDKGGFPTDLEQWKEIFTDYSMWLMEQAVTNPKYNKYTIIIEGCDICLLDPQLMATKPVIIIGGSRLRTSYRRIKRDIQDDHNLLDAIFREFRRKSRYINQLNKEKEEFWDNLSDLTEAVTDMKAHERNDVFHNIEDWESGESNLLWITGLSGSGKSTLSKEIAKEYNAEYIELDNIQRAKMHKWDHTGSKVLDSYIASVGGLKNVFPYCNKFDSLEWKDIICEENDCPVEFNRLFKYIIRYANTHKNERFVVEGVQIAMCTSNETISMIEPYPIILKMNGPLKTEFRREKRSIGYGKARGDSFTTIFKRVSGHVKNWVLGKFYIDNYNDLKYFKSHIGESANILNEVKQFPIEFDKEGNLIIYKSRVGSLAFGDEIDDSVKLLESYRNTNNIEGMKYELAKLWFINDAIEKKLKKRLTNDQYKELIDTRATCLNVFKFNLEYVMKAEKGFNFSDYYNSTPFSDNSIKITANTIKYSMKALL